jgi:hypothetical protein
MGDEGNGKSQQQTENSGLPPRVLVLHGFDDQTAIRIMRAVKQICEEPSGIAFSMTTPTNIDWKVGDLLREVLSEHAYMIKKQQEESGDTAGQ